jgi:hypothetical protein
VRNCGNRVSGGAGVGGVGGSDTNAPDGGTFLPKYTDRFSGWRGLRYGKCPEWHWFALTEYMEMFAVNSSC